MKCPGCVNLKATYQQENGVLFQKHIFEGRYF